MNRLELQRIQDAFADPLKEFVRETDVKMAVLINRSGQVLAQEGFDRVVDLVSVASLAAGINASSRALARQLGEERFEHLHHAGRSRQLFLGHFELPAAQLILVTVFDEDSSIGLVRVFFEEFAKRIGQLPLLDAGRSSVSANNFERDLEVSLDRFFEDLVG